MANKLITRDEMRTLIRELAERASDDPGIQERLVRIFECGLITRKQAMTPFQSLPREAQDELLSSLSRDLRDFDCVVQPIQERNAWIESYLQGGARLWRAVKILDDK